MHLPASSAVALAVLISLSGSANAQWLPCVELDSTGSNQPACQCLVGKTLFNFQKLTAAKPYSDSVDVAGDKYTFYYNPCVIALAPGSVTNNKCTTGRFQAVCQEIASSGYAQSAGNILNSSARYNPGTHTVQFAFGNGFLGRSSSVDFVCAAGVTSPQLKFVEEKPHNHFSFKMATPLACGSSHHQSITITASISFGTLLCIAALCLLVVYIGVGLSYNRFARHQQGVEAIPNYVFWVELPSLVKEGVLFIRKGMCPSSQYQPV